MSPSLLQSAPQRPLSFPITPSSQRSPQLDERPAKLRRSCRAGRLRRAPSRCMSSNPTPFTGCMARRPLISGSHRPSPQQPAPSHCLHRHALTPPFFFFFRPSNLFYYTLHFFVVFFQFQVKRLHPSVSETRQSAGPPSKLRSEQRRLVKVQEEKRALMLLNNEKRRQTGREAGRSSRNS